MQLSGLRTSSGGGASLPESSIGEASSTSTQTTCAASGSATSSPASVCGRSPFGAQGGQTIDLFGPVPVLANLSARQAKELGLLTSGTSGRRSSTSSASAALQSSMESRLRVATSTLGSTLYRMTWKPWTTPSGRCRSRLRASARSKRESGRTGWPTPRATDGNKNIRTLAGALNEVKRKGGAQDLCQAALLCGGEASTASNVRLNPDLSRWLMDIPPCWTSCAPTAMPCTPKRRASSSNQPCEAA